MLFNSKPFIQIEQGGKEWTEALGSAMEYASSQSDQATKDRSKVGEDPAPPTSQAWAMLKTKFFGMLTLQQTNTSHIFGYIYIYIFFFELLH